MPKPKPKLLTCGHTVTFSTPQPKYGEHVFCTECDGGSRVPPYVRKGPRDRSKDKHRSRMKAHPLRNNQHTKGRPLEASPRRSSTST
jgi:hypothetical protein